MSSRLNKRSSLELLLEVVHNKNSVENIPDLAVEGASRP
jgi:hypothetical protein